MSKRLTFILGLTFLACLSVGVTTAKFVVTDKEDKKTSVDNISINAGDTIFKSKYSQILDEEYTLTGLSYYESKLDGNTIRYINDDNITFSASFNSSYYNQEKDNLDSYYLSFTLTSSLENAFENTEIMNNFTSYITSDNIMIFPTEINLNVSANSIQVKFPFAKTSQYDYSNINKILTSDTTQVDFDFVYDFNALNKNISLFGNLSFEVNLIKIS